VNGLVVDFVAVAGDAGVIFGRRILSHRRRHPARVGILTHPLSKSDREDEAGAE
jgi:hypothetical protein